MEKKPYTEIPLKDLIQDQKKTAAEPSSDRAGRKRKSKRAMSEIPVFRMQMIRDGKMKIRVPDGPITTPEVAIEIIHNYLKRMDREVACCLTLDSRLHQIGIATVAMGGLTHVDIDPAEVFKVVLARDNAAMFILGHNHPSSGDPTPSDEDLHTLDVMRQIGIMLNRPMRDFIIIGRGQTHYSHRSIDFSL